MIPRTNVAGTEGVTRAGWARTSSKERWWCSVGCSLPPRGGVRCPTWCSAHSPRCGFLRPSVGFTQVSPTTKSCSNGRFRQHSSHFGSEASALEMRRAQAFGGSSPSASVCVVLMNEPRLLARGAGAFLFHRRTMLPLARWRGVVPNPDVQTCFTQRCAFTSPAELPDGFRDRASGSASRLFRCAPEMIRRTLAPRRKNRDGSLPLFYPSPVPDGLPRLLPRRPARHALG
jgi:hypothetical protein